MSAVRSIVEGVRHLRQENYLSMPWKNGAGTTCEIMREPAGMDDFAWRLSLATLKDSGPFSAYAGYQRAVVLADGAGFDLDIEGAPSASLRSRGAHARFSGAARTTCLLVNGPCTDLSLMVRAPGRIEAVSQLFVGDEHLWAASAGALQILFVLRGRVDCVPGLLCTASPTSAVPHHTQRAIAPDNRAPAREPGEQLYKLGCQDTLLGPAGAQPWRILRASDDVAEVSLLTFFAPTH